AVQLACSAAGESGTHTRQTCRSQTFGQSRETFGSRNRALVARTTPGTAWRWRRRRRLPFAVQLLRPHIDRRGRVGWRVAGVARHTCLTYPDLGVSDGQRRLALPVGGTRGCSGHGSRLQGAVGGTGRVRRAVGRQETRVRA